MIAKPPRHHPALETRNRETDTAKTSREQRHVYQNTQMNAKHMNIKHELYKHSPTITTQKMIGCSIPS